MEKNLKEVVETSTNEIKNKVANPDAKDLLITVLTVTGAVSIVKFTVKEAKKLWEKVKASKNEKSESVTEVIEEVVE